MQVVVAIDPAVSSNPRSDETGIVVAGIDPDERCYVLADGPGCMTPNMWAKRALDLYEEYRAGQIIGETNNGGDLVKEVLRTARMPPFRAVNASRGKYARAEPVAALYEQGKVHHVGTFPDLEDQMCTWAPHGPADTSPDRMDALVWALTHLINRPITRIWT